MTNKLTHHHLTSELVNDSQGLAIMLSQQEDGYNEPNTVLIHPWQLRAVCEQFGIIASDHQHADLTYETTQLWALQDLAGEWCADFAEGLGDGQQPPAMQPERTSAPAAQASLL